MLRIARSGGRSLFLLVIAIGVLALLAAVTWGQTGTDTEPGVDSATSAGEIARECSWFILPDPAVAVNHGGRAEFLTEDQKAGARGADVEPADGQGAVRAEPSAADQSGLRRIDDARPNSGAIDRRPVLGDDEAAKLANLPVGDQDALFRDCLESGAFDAVPASQMTQLTDEREAMLAGRLASSSTANDDKPRETLPPPSANRSSPSTTR